MMSSTLQQFAKVIDEVRENTNTPELCLLSGKFSSSIWMCRTSRFYLTGHDIRIDLLLISVRRRVRNTVVVHLIYDQDFFSSLSLSS